MYHTLPPKYPDWDPTWGFGRPALLSVAHHRQLSPPFLGTEQSDRIGGGVPHRAVIPHEADISGRPSAKFSEQCDCVTPDSQAAVAW